MGTEAVRAAWQLASRQQGVIRRDQALDAGLTARQINYRVMRGYWPAVCPGVYRVEGAPPSWKQRLKAAALWASTGFAISHRAAAALHGFPRYKPGPVEVSLTRRMRAPAGVLVHQVDALLAKDLTFIDGICCTNATRTLIDLALTESDQDVRASVDHALSRKLTSLDRLEAVLERTGQRAGVPFLKALLHQYQGGDGPCESELESRVYELFEAAGLPRPERQNVVRVRGRVRRIDFRLPGSPVVIEADGYAHHASPLAFEKDRERVNGLIARGFRVLHWTWAAIHEDPTGLVQQLLQTLHRG